ncbi:two-component regulator propeller domain-containing protein [Motiliproteus sp. SC1-56]|uniref:ligand-binding sensor domain-containing protein n=1 Tax=Motiliproteus sp. SC1-56 TaxID=2799565 RepID=UPI001A900F11|nr:two-component regulator propeller domain-containing protein [Motiliproteus sp. SC1-56]
MMASYETPQKQQTQQQAPAPTAAAPAAVSPESLVAPQAPAAEAPASKFTHFRVGQRNVKSIYAADDGIVWVGTSGGLVRYDTNLNDYQHYSVKNGLLANGVFHVSAINDAIAVGTYGGGLSLLDPRTGDWQNYNVPDGLGDAFVYDALEMPNGDVWIATWTGVNRVVGGALDQADAWEVYTVENTGGGLPNDWVYALAEGKSGEVWLATEGGLARYDYADGSWQHWTHAEGLGAPYELVKADNKFDRDPAQFSEHHARQKVEQGLEHVTTAYNPNYIVSLEVDKDGNVWAGTWGGGLSRFDGEAWKVYTEADGLPSNHIFMLHEDRGGQLWVGTSHGLAKMQDDGFAIYSPEDGLYSPQVFSMATQPDGTFWVGSFGGLARISSLD